MVRTLLPARRAGLGIVVVVAGLTLAASALAQPTSKPVLHGQNWVAVTGKPLAATAGAMIFAKGGNAVDAACAMLGATSTMWDTLGWGGETQALIYNPKTKEVIGINALGVAPTGATVDYFREQGMVYPPEYGPLAAVTPGTPGGLMVMLAEYGNLSLADVLKPSMDMAAGYPIEKAQADNMERRRDVIERWPTSSAVFLPHRDANDPDKRGAPEAGEIFRQPDLLSTLQELVDAEAAALAAGKSRKEAIYAAYDRFYRGDIADEIVRSNREFGGLFTLKDLDEWEVKLEKPVSTRYRDYEVYKLTTWVQGPAMLQALNILEGMDLKAMGYNSTRYIHALYQTMNLAFADRDFYYGDPYFPPEEPIQGLLSKEYAKAGVRPSTGSATMPRPHRATPIPIRTTRILSSTYWNSGRRSHRARMPREPKDFSRPRAALWMTSSSLAPPLYRRRTPMGGSSRLRRAAAGFQRSSPAIPA